jgi:hypothetical protein
MEINEMRKVNHAKENNGSVAKNKNFQWSLYHSLAIYNLDSIYTFIPKNACSTMRFSIAVQNGFLDENSDKNWIHENNNTFSTSQEFAMRCKYAFVILRCPFRRIASAYLNKVVDGVTEFIPEGSTDPLDVSFRVFLSIVMSQNAYKPTMDSHWRPQVDFLLFENYDDYFCLEDFNYFQNVLLDKGLRLFDTRADLKHDTSSYEKLNGEYSNIPLSEIKKMKDGGVLPTYESLFTDECKDIVKSIYSNDIQLYIEKFGQKGLLF